MKTRSIFRGEKNWDHPVMLKFTKLSSSQFKLLLFPTKQTNASGGILIMKGPNDGNFLSNQNSLTFLFVQGLLHKIEVKISRI